MNNPLEELQQWYVNPDQSLQDDLGALTGNFLPEGDTFAADQLERITNFALQLESTGLTANVIVQKTLFMIKLKDFALDGRSTEEDWIQLLDRHLYMKNAFREKGDPGAVDPLLENFEERKNGWLRVARSWEILTNGPLRNKRIADWYFTQI